MNKTIRRSIVSAVSVAALLGVAAPAMASDEGTVCGMSNHPFGCPGSTEGEPEMLIEMLTGMSS